MSGAKRFRVWVSENEIPTIDDVMCLIGKLPYLDLIDLASILSADADKMADAHGAWEPKSEDEE